MAAFSLLRLLPLGLSRHPFLRFPVPMGSTPCAICDSQCKRA